MQLHKGTSRNSKLAKQTDEAVRASLLPTGTKQHFSGKEISKLEFLTVERVEKLILQINANQICHLNSLGTKLNFTKGLHERNIKEVRDMLKKEQSQFFLFRNFRRIKTLKEIIEANETKQKTLEYAIEIVNSFHL